MEAGHTTAAVEGSPGLEGGSLGLGEDNLGLEEDSPGPARGNLDPGKGSPGAARRFRSLNRKVRGHRGQHHLGRRFVSCMEGQAESLMKLVFWIATRCLKAWLPDGFLSSSSNSSFIFFLRKSMVEGDYATRVGRVIGMQRTGE